MPHRETPAELVVMAANVDDGSS